MIYMFSAEINIIEDISTFGNTCKVSRSIENTYITLYVLIPLVVYARQVRLVAESKYSYIIEYLYFL